MPEHPPLHVVIVCTDQQRYDSLGCTGNPHALTPHLDALAAEGCLFDRLFTANPVSMPSRATIMTGCYPSAHGVWTNGIPMPSSQDVPRTPALDRFLAVSNDPGRVIPSHLPTLPELFADAGYATDALGKLHLAPTQAHRSLGFVESQDRWNHEPELENWNGPYRGFQHVQLTLDHGGVPNGHYRHWLRRHHPAVAQAMTDGHRDDRPSALRDLYPLDCPPQLYPTAWLAERACQRIDLHADRQRPMLLWVGIPDPHHPFTPPRQTLDLLADRGCVEPRRDPPDHTPIPASLADRRAAGRVDPHAARLARRYTDAMVHLIDRAVGQIIQRLKDRGLWDRTVFLFTSDHGDYLGDYGLIRKTDHACRLLNHVPLILRAPGARLPARSSAALSNADLLPTLCQLCGIRPPATLHGQSALDILARGRTEPVLIQCSSTPEQTNLSLIDDRHRLTWYPRLDRLELFDHHADPMEWHDLASAPDAAPTRDRLHQQLMSAFCRSTTPRAGRVANW